MGSVLSSRGSADAPKLMWQDVVGGARGPAAADLTDPHDALLVSLASAPVHTSLKRLNQPNRKCLMNDTMTLVVGTVTGEGGVVTVGVMYDRAAADNARWFLLHGGGVVPVVSDVESSRALQLHCDASTRAVHTADVPFRVQERVITIRVDAGDICW